MVLNARPARRAPRLLVAAAVALAAIAPARSLAAQDAAVGAMAPRSVMVETLDGAPLDLGAYIGKVPVVLEFWATWCPLCRELEPAMRAAHAKHGRDARFVVVAVSVNQTPARVKAHAERHAMPFEIVFDRKGAASGAFDVFATSTVIVIDRSGKIVYVGQGGDQDIEGAVRGALAAR
jgi:peroxiredoxin